MMATPLLAGTPSTPKSNTSGSQSLKSDINNIISMLDSPIAGTTPENEQLLATQIIDQRVLKDVVAYVEVRAHHENRSSCIVRELTALGAEVVPKFTNDVTHVIFKDGKKATRDKAKKKGVHLVSVLWVDSCKRHKNHVAENLFQPALPEDDGTPISIGRLKKTKSMQPKDFDEEVANSAERGKNRRRRQANADKWKLLETPYSPHIPRTVFAAETQPMSPLTLNMSFSPSLTVPDTPPSMRRKLAELKRKQVNFGDSDLDSTTSSVPTAEKEIPLHRKLFEGNLNGVVSASDSPRTPPGSPGTTTTTNSSPMLRKSPRIRTSSSDTDSSFSGKTIPKKQKHKLFVAEPASLPPTELIEPTKVAKGKDTKPKLFEPPVGKKRGRPRTKSNDPESEELDKTKPRKRVRMNDPPEIQEEMPVLPSQPRRNLRRQSIATCTPSKEKTLPVRSSPKRRGRRSMVLPPENIKAATDTQSTADAYSIDDTQSTDYTESTMYKCQVNGPVEPSPSTSEKDLKVMPHSIDNRTEKAAEPKRAAVQRRRSVRLNSTLSNSGKYIDSIPEEVIPCNEDAMNATADDSVLRILPKKRILKAVSSARKTKVQKQTTGSDSNKTVVSPKVSHTQNLRRVPTASSASPFPCLSHSRKSLEDFHPSQFNKPATKSLPPSQKLRLDISEDSEPQEEQRRRVYKANKARHRRPTTSSSDEGSTCTNGPKKLRPKNTIVTTSMPSDDRDLVLSVVKQLGGYRLTSNVVESTTHLVIGEARRTLNVLYAIVHGCWLVSREWVLDSLEAGKWVDEEPYEIHDYFPAAQKSRMKRLTKEQEMYTPEIFSTKGAIYVAEQTTPPHHHLVALIKLGGGQVTHCSRRAEVCVGTSGRPDTISVSEQWILDSITNFRALDFDAFLIKDERNQRERSPDF